MTHRIHTRLFGLLAMTLPLVACAQSNAPTAPAEQAVAARPAAPAPQLVSGLPDFTQLVDRVGPGVVNVETVIGPRRGPRMAGGTRPDMDQLPDFFRRFFGPDFQMPREAPEDGPRGRGMGSGFIISADGYVLTNHHVIDGAETVKVKLSDRREFDAKVVGSDEQYDVALLKIDAKGLPTVRVGDSNTLKPGQWVVAIGSPFGLDHSVTAGIVSAVGRAANADQRYVPFIQTDVAINHGNSGGPLLNTRGEVVGINSQIFSNSGGYMGVSFAIPMDVAMNVAQQIRTTGKVSRGQIGVVVGAINADAARGFKLPDTRGALVNDVRPGGPADKAGLQPGDVIRAVDGRPIEDSSDLPPMIGSMAPGSTAKLSIYRDGKPIEREVMLTKLDDAQVATGPSQPSPRPAAATGKGNALGVIGQDLAGDDRRDLGLRSGEGVQIARIDGKAARSAGLRPGDIILRVGTTPVGSASALDRALAGVGGDDTVMLLVRRGGATQYVPVTPDKRG